MGHNGNEIFLHGIKPRFPGNIADKPTASLTGKARQVTHDKPRHIQCLRHTLRGAPHKADMAETAAFRHLGSVALLGEFSAADADQTCSVV